MLISRSPVMPIENALQQIFARVAIKIKDADTVPAPNNAAKEKRKRRTREIVIKSGLPKKLVEFVRRGKLDIATVANAISEKIDSGKFLIVASGPPGTGKTYSAAFIMTRLIIGDSIDPSAQFVSAPKFCHECPSSTNVAKIHGSKYKQYAKTKYLVIDDVGYEEPKDSALVKQLIHHRHANGSLTILTTNLGATEFVRRYGTAIERRIEDDGAFLKFEERIRKP